MTQNPEIFDILLSHQGGDAFQTKVRSPKGEAQAMLHLPFRRDQLAHWAEVHGNLPGENSKQPLPDDSPLKGMAQQEVGMLLYRALFVGAVKNRFDTTRTYCEENQRDLRIVLRFETASKHHLAAAELPWEMLCDPASRQFLCSERHITLVRYLEHEHRLQRPPLPAPLRVLVVTPNPKGDLNREAIQEGLREKLSQRFIYVHFLEKATLDALFNHLVDHDYDVLHFTGHGGFIDDRGALLFEREGGGADVVDDQRFLRALQQSKRLRLVHLVSCNTGLSKAETKFNPFHGMAYALVGGKVPAVVAMQFLFRVNEAGIYCDSFYDRIAKGEPLDRAVDTARTRLSLLGNDTVTWATPVVFLRDQNAHLFLPRQIQHVQLNSYEGTVPALLQESKEGLLHRWHFQHFFESGVGASSRRVTYPGAWQKIQEELEERKKTLDKNAPIHFEGHCVLSIWFTVGHLFQQSTGYETAFRQLNQKKECVEVWRRNRDVAPMELARHWVREGVAEEMVVSINCVREEFEQVLGAHLATSPQQGLPWLQLTVADPSRRKLGGDTDANALVNAVAPVLRGLPARKIHLFLCVPSAVALFLGLEVTIGKTFVVYEFQNPDYTPAFTIN